MVRATTFRVRLLIRVGSVGVALQRGVCSLHVYTVGDPEWHCSGPQLQGVLRTAIVRELFLFPLAVTQDFLVRPTPRGRSPMWVL